MERMTEDFIPPTEPDQFSADNLGINAKMEFGFVITSHVRLTAYYRTINLDQFKAAVQAFEDLMAGAVDTTYQTEINGLIEAQKQNRYTPEYINESLNRIEVGEAQLEFYDKKFQALMRLAARKRLTPGYTIFQRASLPEA